MKPAPKKAKPYTKFTDDNLPKPHDWRSGLPRAAPEPLPIALGPERKQLEDQTLLEAYFGNSTLLIELDMMRRPEHYSPKQHEIIEKLKTKQALGPDVDYRDINEIVLKYTETTKHKEKRDKILKRAEEKLKDEDPTVERMNEEESKKTPPLEEQTSKDAGWIKII